MSSFVSFASLAVFASTLVACSAAPTDPVDEETVEQSEEALTACGSANYNEALAHPPMA